VDFSVASVPSVARIDTLVRFTHPTPTPAAEDIATEITESTEIGEKSGFLCDLGALCG
jgi:hypothetical protein